jgi:hypothetical protein
MQYKFARYLIFFTSALAVIPCRADTVLQRLAALESKVANLQTKVQTLKGSTDALKLQVLVLQNKDVQQHDQIVALKSQNSRQQSTNSQLGSEIALLKNRVTALEAASQGGSLAELQASVSSLTTTVNAHQEVLQFFSRTDSEIFITAANLHIVNGIGFTQSQGGGLGNLIVGYNETRGVGADVRTGSHNIIVGNGQNYSSYGGIVGGRLNTISGPGCSVLGGMFNSASGINATISGGENNVASGQLAAIAGGHTGTASGIWSTIAGGLSNTSSASYTSVGGGQARTAGNDLDWVAGALIQDF